VPESLTNILSPSGWSDFATAEDWAADAAKQQAVGIDSRPGWPWLEPSNRLFNSPRMSRHSPVAQPWCFGTRASLPHRQSYLTSSLPNSDAEKSTDVFAFARYVLLCKTTGWPTRLCQGTRWETGWDCPTVWYSFFLIRAVCCIEKPPRLPTGLAGINSTINFRKVSSGPRSGKGGNATNTRASSLWESLRLRNYFFLRRQLGPQYLALLSFPQPSHIYAQWIERWARVQLNWWQGNLILIG